MIWISNSLPNSGSWKESELKRSEQTHATVDVNSWSTRKLNNESKQENAAISNYMSGNYNIFSVIEKNNKQGQKLNVFPYDTLRGVARLSKNSNVSILLEKRGLWKWMLLFSAQYFFWKWMWSYNNTLKPVTILLSLHMVDSISLSSEHHL